MGTYLTDKSGRTLYMFASDTSKKSTCSAACLTYWPAFTTKGGPPKVAGGLNSSLLGTISRSDGTKQVTYGGHPLYYYLGDKNAGDTNGQGSTNFGAEWWILAPSGKPITSSAGSSSSNSSGGGGGGYGYG
jgi:predicted lipoprotein with Yx(FWY)xxD motif